ncbi:hypothetical protein, partial [Parasedimentitalea maritima]|uniref:hypothetical protein n=1 Tax=Parasedimentitalea maritima TaxID=2578117 RepID=UPI001ADCF261
PAGSAASAEQAAKDFAVQRANHTGTQLLSTISDAGTAAAANVGTGANDVPKTSQADARYAQLSGANDFDTMPTVNGDPIVESDSNSDGNWTRWADGTQIVTSDQFFSGVSMTVSANGFFRSSTPEQTYPVAFATGQAPEVSGIVNVSNSPGAFLGRYGGGASGVDLELFGAASESSIDADFTYTAAGRWK